jgi:hypothetical protein
MNQPDPFILGLSTSEPEHAPAPAAGAEWRDLARKAELEAAMAAAPEDGRTRLGYFELLTRIAATHTGLLPVLLPEIGVPLYIRCGTPDIAALLHVFRDHGYALPGLRATPQRIVVVGAYAGYAAVDLARRHTRALLLCAEPLADNFRLLSVNTTLWRRIRVAPTALWHSTTRLAPSGRFQADWAVRLTDEALDAERTIGAMSMLELLTRAGWSNVDMVVCDAAGAEREIFSDPLAPWLRQIDVALVRSYDQFAPGASAMVAACFPEEIFAHRQHGAFDLFERRAPLTAFPPLPREHPLLRPELGIAPFMLQNIANASWAFFVFDGASCQLHPNAPGEPPARATFPVRLDGYTRLLSGLFHAGQPPAAPIVFAATVQREDGTVLASGETTLAARGVGRLNVPLPEGLRGQALVVLQTAMAPEAVNNQMAWARWIEPRLS